MACDQLGLRGGEEAAVGEEETLRRGPWTVEEDVLLANYIAANGEGRWNALARRAGLKRTGKSCRLRWLNYLRPDLRRGGMAAEEQLLILELHARWGNRWSKIAQHLPGRTDNEIKNYWRTRVQRHARQLRCDVGSQRFRDLVRCLWIPRLLERIHASANPGEGDDVLAQATAAALPVVAADGRCSWPADDVFELGPGAAADVELSCTTALSSSPSVSTDGCGARPLPPPAPMMATAESAHGSVVSSNNCSAAMHEHDTALWQPPQTQTHGGLIMMGQEEQHHDQQAAGSQQLLGAETWWSDQSSLHAGLYADVGFPELELGGETMWGACADDLWCTDMLGL
ncbi:hypothetical protein ZWY2020_010166 [Hordeum vulgare]|uniref:Uncharacterized protein n=2 Tax=Hordeum vulgare subsp. vulgare TaxID=112509 RepID=A0A8I6WNK0_HORVV|nr:hypothetical protein ZWY2020_010166 [Hordeum vulgare]